MEIAKHRNGIRHPENIKKKVREMRSDGMTHREIAKQLNVSLGSADLWTKGILLSPEQKMAIQARRNQHKMTKKEREKAIARLKPFWRIRRYRDEDLIEKIKRFYAEHGRIPLKREFNSLRTFRERFGSWNNAIRIAGFDPNPILFAHKFIARDGHRCDSFTEMIIDNWFDDHGIEHERNWKYEKTKMTADFFIRPNIVVEFFGLAGVQKKYDELILLKKSFCHDHRYELIALYPKDIFPQNKNNLSIMLERFEVSGSCHVIH